MTLLLDTHTVAWWFFGDKRLSPKVREMIERNEGSTFVSAVSAFEMAQKYRLGKWPQIAPLMDGFDRLAGEHGMLTLPMTPAHAVRAGLLPGPHRDPFDRMLVAQALIEGLGIVSRDKGLRDLGVEPVWG